MFAKLLKQEWRSTRGVLGLLCLICLTGALLGGGAMRFLVAVSAESEEMNLPVLLCILAMITAILAIAVCLAAAVFLVIWRFYKSRFTDEGYLTFTLPVTTHQILLSSLANSAIVIALMTLVGIFSYGVLLLMGFSGIKDFFPAFWEAIPRGLQLLGEMLGKVTPSHAVLTVLDFLLGFASELMILMLSVTIGAIIAKKHKVLAAIGVYYGIGVGLSIVGSIAMMGTVFTKAEAAIPGTLLGLSALMGLLLFLGSYFLTHYLMDKKLNLN